MIEEGAEIPFDKYIEVRDEINEAIADGHFYIVERKGKEIGFFTYFEIKGKVFINNCVIFKRYRDRNNFISIRRFFREKYPDQPLYWMSKRRNEKLCIVK